jgi:chromosome segregation ATPase
MINNDKISKFSEEQYNNLVQERKMLKMTIDFLSTQNLELNKKISRLENQIEMMEKENVKLIKKIKEKEQFFKKKDKKLKRNNSVLVTKKEKKKNDVNKIEEQEYLLLSEINQLKLNLNLLENNKNDIQSLSFLSNKINSLKSNMKNNINLNEYFSLINEENDLNHFFESNSNLPILLTYNKKIFELIPRDDINENDVKNNYEQIKSILPQKENLNESKTLTLENILIS